MAELKPQTIKLHGALIRNLRGMISAWEEWVFHKLPQDKVEDNPDPKTHFEKLNSQARR